MLWVLRSAKELVDMGFKTIDELRNSPNVNDVLNDKQKIGLKFYDDILSSHTSW